jgi:hypothetical protein
MERLYMDLKAKHDVKFQIDEMQREIDRKCDKDYPKSRVCYVRIQEAFR